MKLNCQYEVDDYIAANYLHLKPRRFILALMIIAYTAIIALGVHEIFFNEAKISSNVIVFLAMFLIIFPYVYFVSIPRRIRKTFRQQKALSVPFDAEITPVDYYRVSSIGDARLKWEDFLKYKAGEKIITVYESDRVMHMFPKRWFTDEQDEEFMAILQNALGYPK